MTPATWLTTHALGTEWSLWVRVCPTRGCECGVALVLATSEGRERLGPTIAQIEAAAAVPVPIFPVAAACADEAVVPFALRLEDGEGEAPIHRDEVDADPRIAALAASLTGDDLDALHRRMRASRGLDPQPPFDVTGDWVAEWSPGHRVFWTFARPDDRLDRYVDEDGDFFADETYCVDPGCGCTEVFVVFGYDEGVTSAVVDFATGAVEPPSDAEVWRRYAARHPGWRERLARRHAAIRAIGPTLLARAAARAPSPVRAVGRNEACPCGSGKKYKRCCGAG